MDREELLRAPGVDERWRSGRPRSPAALDAAVLCHQAGPVARWNGWWRSEPIPGFGATVRRLRRTRIGVATGFGVGAPAAVVMLEKLVSAGVGRFVSVGIAGGLSAGSRTGQLIVVDRAISAEGTSHHYVTEHGLHPSHRLTSRLTSALAGLGVELAQGTVCSTDAPYRTTRETVQRWMSDGGMAVDMEAAGLMSAARFRGVELAVGLCVADHRTATGWNVDADRSVVFAGVQTLFVAAVRALAQ